MTDTAPHSVLKRKAAAGASQPGASAMTPVRALHQALAKTAQDLMAMPIEIVELREMRLSLAEIPERLEERALLMMIAGPQESLGLVALSPATVATLIEMQTTGRISSGAVAARRPTRTDAAMSVGFVDQMLGELEVLLATDAAIVWLGGFRYTSYLSDPRPLGLMMEDIAYRGFHITLKFAEGVPREGSILLALPAEGRGRAPIHSGDEKPSGDGPVPGYAQTEWSEQIERSVMAVRTQIEAVFDRITLPLSDVLALKPGSLLPLPAQSLNHVRVQGFGHRFVAHARLGQCQGNYAVRIFMGPEADPDELALSAPDLSPGTEPGKGAEFVQMKTAGET
jgi:flagellar motor switch protein FliM